MDDLCIIGRVVRSTSLGTVFLAGDGSVTQRLLQSGGEAVVIGVAVLAVLVAVVFYLIGRIRAKTLQHEPTASELISKFREFHSRGELSDEEFRTIKTALAAKLKEELKDNGETG